jgi:hypothetical protein
MVTLEGGGTFRAISAIRYVPGDARGARLSVGIVCGRLGLRGRVHGGRVETDHHEGKGRWKVRLSMLGTVGNVQPSGVPGPSG